MKKIKLILLAVALSGVASAQWRATNLTESNFLAIAGMASYQDELYSVVFSGFSATYYQLNDNQESWSEITPNGISGIAAALQSTGTHLYMSSVGLGFGQVYRSTDGTNFQLDTDGLPDMLSGVPLVNGFKSFDGRIVVNLGSAGYWIKPTSTSDWEKIDPETSLNGGVDPMCYSQDTIFAYDNSGTHTFYFSADWGKTWKVRNTSLPASFVGTILEANSSTGRLYLVGGKTDDSDYSIYYSDDNGFNWTKADLTGLIGTNNNGGQQRVTALYANGQNIYVALENDESGTTPDVLSSKTGIQNLEVDITGLVSDPGGVMNGNKFLEHDNLVAMALNTRDIYVQDKATHITSDIAPKSALFPNPATDFFMLNADQDLGRIDIIDLSGRVIRSQNGAIQQINISDLGAGTYLVATFNTQDQLITRHRLVKQ